MIRLFSKPSAAAIFVAAATAIAAGGFAGAASALQDRSGHEVSPEVEKAHRDRNVICHQDWQAVCGTTARGADRHQCGKAKEADYSPQCRAAMEHYTAVRKAALAANKAAAKLAPRSPPTP